jgi:hypothetical protein
MVVMVVLVLMLVVVVVVVVVVMVVFVLMLVVVMVVVVMVRVMVVVLVMVVVVVVVVLVVAAVVVVVVVGGNQFQNKAIANPPSQARCSAVSSLSFAAPRLAPQSMSSAAISKFPLPHATRKAVTPLVLDGFGFAPSSSNRVTLA